MANIMELNGTQLMVLKVPKTNMMIYKLFGTRLGLFFFYRAISTNHIIAAEAHAPSLEVFSLKKYF